MVAWVEDIEALLADARDQLEALRVLHDQALEDPKVRKRFQTRVKNILEHQRSALDYLAVGLTEEFGTPKGKIYYPLAQSKDEFPAEMESKMPGVAGAKPSVARQIEWHQPFAPHHGHMFRELNQLARQQKHNRLTLQIVKETYKCRVSDTATGSFVEWYGIRFEPGAITAEHPNGAIEFRPAPGSGQSGRDLVDVESGPTVRVFGVPIDPETQRPVPDPRLEVESGPWQRWWFVAPHLPVVQTLEGFNNMLPGVVNDVLHEAFAS